MNNDFGTLLVNVLSDFGDISYVIMRRLSKLILCVPQS